MQVSELRLVKNCVEYLPQSDISKIPGYTRGLYVLFNQSSEGRFEVVYVGMAGGEKAGIRGRLRSHRRRKGKLWTHFSAFKVWENIREEEIRELEGLFRHIYRKDTQANKLNRQRKFKKLAKISNKKWLNEENNQWSNT